MSSFASHWLEIGQMSNPTPWEEEDGMAVTS